MCHWVWWSWRVISHSSTIFVVQNYGNAFDDSYLFFSVSGYLSYFHSHTYLRFVVWIWKIWFAAKVERIEKLIFCFYFIFLQSCRPWTWSWYICKYDLPWTFCKLIFSTGKLICDSNSDCGKINPVGYGFKDSSNFWINNSTLLLCMGLSLS